MTLDRAEFAGTSAAVLFHAALIAALSLSLASVSRPPEPPAMEVELVEDVGLRSAAPTPAPPPSRAPEIGAAEPEPLPPPPAPAAEPAEKPTAQPKVQPKPVPSPPGPLASPELAAKAKPQVQIAPKLERAPGQKSPPTKREPAAKQPAPNPVSPRKPEPEPKIAPVTPPPSRRLATTPKPAPKSSPAARASALDDDFLKRLRGAAERPASAPRVAHVGDDILNGIADDPAAAQTVPATVSASAMAGIVQAIRRQVQPCADRQVDPGPGASRIQVKLHLQLSPTGRLIRQPEVASVTGVDDENERYVERVKDIALATFVGCAPLTGLPPELYKTADGRGWGDFFLNYKLP